MKLYLKSRISILEVGKNKSWFHYSDIFQSVSEKKKHFQPNLENGCDNLLDLYV